MLLNICLLTYLQRRRMVFAVKRCSFSLFEMFNKTIVYRSHFVRAVHSDHPRQRRNGPFCCCMTSFAANALQCIVNREENPQISPCPWDFVTLPEEDRITAIGSMYKNFGKDRASGSGDILPDRQRDRHTDGRTDHNTSHRCRG